MLFLRSESAMGEENGRTKRENGEEMDGQMPETKRQKIVEEQSRSPPAFNNSLLPLASYDDDDDEEEEERRRRVISRRRDEHREVENIGGRNALGYNHDDDEDDEDAEDSRGRGFCQGMRRQIEVRRDCPYLDTVNRQVLDFDFEKFCSVSLTNLNVYACLVCGKYFQGRGPKSHAYTHSLEAGHHVYISLRTEKVYCLQDCYAINDPSLDDIRHVLNPRFTVY